VIAENRLFSLDGRVALVTGASRGLGLAMAEGLAEAGATVVANGRSADTLEAVARALHTRGLKADTSPFDVTDHGAAQAAIDAITARYGRLDILIANAGINHRVALADWTPADWDRLLAANLKACFFLAQSTPLLPRRC
jgi:gluconate 5-dehydrogenase